VVAHELGHNFGSLHTHACVWGTDGRTAIDNCAALEGGNCSGNIINNVNIINDYVGTIMSYCHTNQRATIKVDFHPQVASLIQAKYNAALSSCLAENWYVDADGDGFGSSTTLPCGIRFGGVSNNLDADDNNKVINPNAKEICGNRIDENGNGVTDEPNLALRFDGVDDVVTFDNALGNFGIGDFTIEMRIKTTATNATILSKRLSCDANNNFWEIYTNQEGFLQIEWTGGSSAGGRPNSKINDNQWHHIAIVKEKEQVRIAVDGIFPNGSWGGFTGSADVNTALKIGSSVCNRNRFNGSIDELRIWNTVRSVSAINELKDATIQPNHQSAMRQARDCQTYSRLGTKCLPVYRTIPV
jgi:hypothetical protein